MVRRRPEDARRRLPADLEAFAAGDDDALWRREQRGGKLNDPRPVALVPGVANRDARAVYEARVRRMSAALERSDRDSLAEELAEAVRLRLWRAYNVVGFDAMAEAVLGMPADEARSLAHAGAVRLGFPCEPGEEPEIAMWMRAESGLLEGGGGIVRRRGETFVLEVAIDDAATALAAVGRRAAPLAKEPSLAKEQGGRKVVVDRPKGVEPLAKIIARDRPREE